jgi:hypothetical protein
MRITLHNVYTDRRCLAWSKHIMTVCHYYERALIDYKYKKATHDWNCPSSVITLVLNSKLFFFQKKKK